MRRTPEARERVERERALPPAGSDRRLSAGSEEGAATGGALDHARRTEQVSRAIEQSGLSPGPPFSCPYLPGRSARQLTLVPSPIAPGVYHSLMDLNFRRLGPVFYRPECEGCRECRMIRVPVAEFRASRSQRRCRARNRDVSVEVARPTPTEEKYRLYARYLGGRHPDGQMEGSADEFHSFLYTSTVRTVEILYRAGGRLLGVGIADVEPTAMSAAYCYFDPGEAARSIGVLNVLSMIEECRRSGVPHLYLGYYVRDCRKMSYKAAYRPCEVLEADGRWTRLGR